MGKRKTDNDNLMVAPNPFGVVRFGGAYQIPLPIEVEEPAPQLTEEQRKQRANFEAMCTELRVERDITLAIARYLYPQQTFESLTDVRNEELRNSREAYQAISVSLPYNVPYPEAWSKEVPEFSSSRGKPRQKKPYIPWTQERRQEEAVRRLKKRVLKRYSFPNLWIDYMQEKLLEDPWRFGVCPLPGAVEACVIPNPELIILKEKAIALEMQTRDREQGLVQPLQLPVSLKVKERVAIELQERYRA